MAAIETTQFRQRLCHSLVADVLKQVEVELLEVKSIRILSSYPWAPGKRLRPIAFLLSYLSVRLAASNDVSVNGRESKLAAAIELLHEASLVHDDLVDGSDVRRGVPSMHMLNGQGLALLVGDYMVFRALKLILDAAVSPRDIVLAQELANTGLQVAHGEVDQLDQYLHCKDWTQRMSMENYLNVIGKKTAAFFAGCCEAGAAVAGAGTELRLAYRTFGIEMGLLFQMVDDIMDVLGDSAAARKTLRNNLTEGTVTLPMIHAWQMSPEDPALKRLAKGKKLGPQAQATLYRRLAGAPVLARCRATMDAAAGRAREALGQMPSNIYTLGLSDLLEYVSECAWGGLSKPLHKGAVKRQRKKKSNVGPRRPRKRS